MPETYEQAQESYLQAVGSKAWDAGVEAGEWITWSWAKATDTAGDIYGAAAQWVDDAVYSPQEISDDTRGTIEKGFDRVADVIKTTVTESADVAENLVDDVGDAAKAVPYLVAAVGGLAVFLYFNKKKR